MFHFGTEFDLPHERLMLGVFVTIFSYRPQWYFMFSQGCIFLKGTCEDQDVVANKWWGAASFRPTTIILFAPTPLSTHITAMYFTFQSFRVHNGEMRPKLGLPSALDKDDQMNLAAYIDYCQMWGLPKTQTMFTRNCTLSESLTSKEQIQKWSSRYLFLIS